MSDAENPYAAPDDESLRPGPSKTSARPTSVTVLAILGIVFGGLGTLCSPFGLIPYVAEFPGQEANPVIDMVKDDGALFAGTVGSIVLGTLLALVLLIGSIGALSLKPWARSLLVGYGVGALVLGVLGLLFNLFVMIPSMRQQLAGDPAADAAIVGGIVGGVIGGLVGMILPLLMLIFMTRPRVKAAFGAKDDGWDE